jgi:acetate kinase
MNILVLNAGSSSLKFQVIDTVTTDVLGKGNFERIGDPEKSFVTVKWDGNKEEFKIPVTNHKEALSNIIDKLNELVLVDGKKIDAVGHRVVHGGDKFKDAVLINDEVIENIKACIPLAPLHNPACVSGIEACSEVLPGVPAVAVFDTAFHQTIPQERYIYAIPYKYYEKYGVRKYGFHGISHDYVSSRLAEIKGVPVESLKIINCHLGQGASICAIDGGKSVETSMGFTPVAGIPMGTRCGDLDPAIVTFLMKNEGIDADEMDRILNKESGKKGISGISDDDRDIEAAIA